MKRIYLDVCTISRPFDDQNDVQIRLETDAYMLILKAVQRKQYAMIISPAHIHEIAANSNIVERLELEALIAAYGTTPAYDLKAVRERAEYLFTRKFGIADAAHAAFAEKSADAFISCDRRLVRQCARLPLAIPAMDPVEFYTKETIA
ncbi:MAG: PIN domain-containing protein [Planctomycetota bacterium]